MNVQIQKLKKQCGVGAVYVFAKISLKEKKFVVFDKLVHHLFLKNINLRSIYRIERLKSTESFLGMGTVLDSAKRHRRLRFQ